MATDSQQPNKRLKALIPNSSCTIKEETNQFEPNQPISFEVSDSSSCGICLCDNGRAIRGQIDSCDHYFCFVCIMEWAKVESRCPMCKRRFTTIRRPPQHGVFPSERVVNVPKRDQVYHLSGNTTIEPFDPYANIECSLCRSAADECLLLLCDLCDSAAHTYCVGLGATVPEGDWFCHDCVVSRAEHDNIVEDSDNIDQDLCIGSDVIVGDGPCVSMSDVVENDRSELVNADVVEVGKDDVSIFDIVHDPNEELFVRPQARLYSVASSCERQWRLANEIGPPGERSLPAGLGERIPQSDDKVKRAGARTLSRCRNVSSYIQALRKNWNSLRSGSLRFSSSLMESTGKSIGKCNDFAISHGDSGQPHSMCSPSDQQLTTNGGLPGIITQVRRSCDIDKAWKMMNKAKSIQQAYRKTKRSVLMVSKDPSCKVSASRKATDGTSSLHLSRSRQLGTTGLGNNMTKKQCKLYSPEKHISANLEMQKHCTFMIKEIAECSNRILTTSSPSSRKACEVQNSIQSNGHLDKLEALQQQNICRASLNVPDQENGPGHLTTLFGSVLGTSESLNTKSRFNTSSPSNEEDVKTGKVVAKSKFGKGDDAKSEIQSLVKINLKLLNRDNKLGANAFKEVARLATHTILAACGLGHSRHVFQASANCVCRHSECIQQLRKSTLMPNSCRECFYVYVTNVVNSILSEKVPHAES